MDYDYDSNRNDRLNQEGNSSLPVKQYRRRAVSVFSRVVYAIPPVQLFPNPFLAERLNFKDVQKRATGSPRCHSCNTTDTPEWRRGPDGARTLCNACGLRKD
jgi:hypothetical protein